MNKGIEYRELVEDGLHDYLIGSDGSLYSRRSGRLLKMFVSNCGYGLYYMRKLGSKKNVGRLAHRLVAIAFIENPLGKVEVNHIDCNKLNNDVSNLEWCSKAENSLHASASKLYRQWSKELGDNQAYRYIDGKQVVVVE